MNLLEKVFGIKNPDEHDDAYDSLRNHYLGQAVNAKQSMLDRQMAMNMANSMKNAQNMLGNQIKYQDLYNSSGGNYTMSVTGYPTPDSPLPSLTEEFLEHEAGKASLEELADFWVTRWQHSWVKRSELDDDFYTITAVRLMHSGYLETHELANGKRVFRLIERK